MSQEQIATLLYVIVVVGGALFVVAAALLWKEYRTLTDKVPGNHITAVVRAAWARQPGAFLIVIVLLSIALAYLGSHFFWSGAG
jgi:hypothetical protein